MIKIINNNKAKYGNTCQHCFKVFNSNEYKNLSCIYIKEENKRGKYLPVCKEHEQILINKF